MLPAVSRKVGKPVKLEKKESRPATRVILLLSRNVDLIAGTMTDAPQRRADVDFSLTFFVTGGQFLVKEGSPIKGINDLAGKRVAALVHTTYARIIREQVPKAIPAPSGRSCKERSMRTPAPACSSTVSSTRRQT